MIILRVAQIPVLKEMIKKQEQETEKLDLALKASCTAKGFGLQSTGV